MNEKFVVALTLEDDQTLFEIGTFLYVVSEKIRAGESIPELPDLLNSAGSALAQVMAGAYERMSSNLENLQTLENLLRDL